MSRHLVSELSRLRLSSKYRREQGKLVVSTRTVVEDVARFAPDLISEFVSTQEPDQALLSLLGERPAPWSRVSAAQLRAVTGMESPDGVAACVRWPRTVAAWSARCAQPPPPPTNSDRTLVLDGVQDPANLGLIIRTAFALNWTRLVLTAGCVDVFNDKTVRVAKAALLRMPEVVTQLPTESLGAALAFFHRTESRDVRPPLCVVTSAAAIDSLPAAELPSTRVLVLGSESHGVSQTARRSLDDAASQLRLANFHLPSQMSLNVAVAGAIIMDRIAR